MARTTRTTRTTKQDPAVETPAVETPETPAVETPEAVAPVETPDEAPVETADSAREAQISALRAAYDEVLAMRKSASTPGVKAGLTKQIDSIVDALREHYGVTDVSKVRAGSAKRAPIAATQENLDSLVSERDSLNGQPGRKAYLSREIARIRTALGMEPEHKTAAPAIASASTQTQTALALIAKLRAGK